MFDFRKKPLVIEAVQFVETREACGGKPAPFFGYGLPGVVLFHVDLPQWLKDALKKPEGTSGAVYAPADGGLPEGGGLMVETLEGYHVASPGDWIIRGVAGEIYPCKPEIFAATYEPAGSPFGEAVSGMSFSDALNALKGGAKVARRGWNGKGMWVALTPGSAFEARHAKCGHAAAKRADELDDPEAEIELLPHIDMKAADGCIVVGWLASQTDMLAEDWEVVL